MAYATDNEVARFAWMLMCLMPNQFYLCEGVGRGGQFPVRVRPQSMNWSGDPVDASWPLGPTAE